MNDRAKRVVEITAQAGDLLPEGGNTSTPAGALVVVKWAAPSLTDAEAVKVRDWLVERQASTSPDSFAAAVYDVLGPDVEVRTPEYYETVTLGGVAAPAAKPVEARPRCGVPVPDDAPAEHRGTACTLATGHAGEQHNNGRGLRVTSWSWRVKLPPPDPVAERRAREAPLVALVAAVPSWADPVAWRAAVLALVDMCTIKDRYTLPDVWPSMRDAVIGALRAHVDDKAALPENPWSPAEVAVIAYARALAPSAVVRPEWRERLPHGLACNAHEVP